MNKIIWETQYLEFKKNGSLGYGDEENEEGDDSDFFENAPGEEEVEIENLISTPFGVFSMDNRFNPYYTYKFYMAHTNFGITEEFAEIIEEMPGVEVFNVISRYRFLIAIGKAFDPVEVRKNITNCFCEDTSQIEEILSVVNYVEDELYRDYIMQIVSDIDEVYEKWLLVTFDEPEFDCEFIGLKEDGDGEQFEKDAELFRKKYKSKGIFLEKT
jgi:hypothetical protein